jgi:hypothetical protein
MYTTENKRKSKENCERMLKAGEICELSGNGREKVLRNHANWIRKWEKQYGK